MLTLLVTQLFKDNFRAINIARYNIDYIKFANMLAFKSGAPTNLTMLNRMVVINIFNKSKLIMIRI